MSTEPDKIETLVELDVPPGQAPTRLDVYVTEKTANATRSKVQRGIKEGRVDVNGEPATKVSTLVQPGDYIVCRVLRPPPIEIVPEPIPLDVVYEDEALLVVDKPAGMVVHPAYGHRSGTLVNALLHHVGAEPMSADDVEDADDDDVGLATATAGPRYDGDPTVRPGLVPPPRQGHDRAHGGGEVGRRRRRPRPPVRRADHPAPLPRPRLGRAGPARRPRRGLARPEPARPQKGVGPARGRGEVGRHAVRDHRAARATSRSSAFG